MKHVFDVNVRLFLLVTTTTTTKQMKRKRALLFGYTGTGYGGLQTQGGYAKGVMETVEDELHRALCRVGGISEENGDSMRKIDWSRAARTDRGVHAAAQVRLRRRPSKSTCVVRMTACSARI